MAALICSGQVSGAQTVTLFGNALPSTPVDSDTAAVTLGVKFWTSQPGTVAGIRFYRGYKASSSGYTVKLFLRQRHAARFREDRQGYLCGSVLGAGELRFAHLDRGEHDLRSGLLHRQRAICRRSIRPDQRHYERSPRCARERAGRR